MRIEKIDKEDWKKFSEDAHKICFEEQKRSDLDRIDFALLAITTFDSPAGYITCRELDRDTIYWQFGGAFPSVKGTVGSFRAYNLFLAWSLERYKRVVTYIENTNRPMLRMASAVGFVITGIRNYKGDVMLEHFIERKNALE